MGLLKTAAIATVAAYVTANNDGIIAWFRSLHAYIKRALSGGVIGEV